MPDVLGYRGKWAVLVPSTNTVVEPEYYAMAPAGITVHASRIYIEDQDLSTDGAFEAFLDQMRRSIDRAIAEAVTLGPDHVVMGMSAETFWGGREGNFAFKRRVERLAGMEVTTGAEACHRALELLGARRLGVITPYQPIADAQVRRFFQDCGYEIEALKALRCRSAIEIAMVSEDRLRQAILEVNRADPDAIVQVGTNLAMTRLADEAERWLNKPVIAINAATWWYALRRNGIADQVQGFGSLLREH